MTEEFDTRQCLGPLVNQIYIAQLCDLDERVWEVFRTHARERGPIEHVSQDYPIFRDLCCRAWTSTPRPLSVAS
jgi:hypothetical protein